MTEKNILKTKNLERIARYLMLHGSFTDNLSLLNGKTGFALFFYEYSRYSGKKLYSDFADELLGEIYREINELTPLNFRDGLCGIGWAIAYFLKNNFVKGDPFIVLEDIDKKIIEWDVRHISDFSLERGLCGIACYLIARRQADNHFLADDYCKNLIVALNKKKETVFLAGMLEKILKGEVNDNFYNPVFEIIKKIKFIEKTLFENPIAKGINNNGYAGIGLKLIMDGLSDVSRNKTNRISTNTELKQKIYIFNSISRAASYGIGTYIDNLIEAIKNSNWEFGIIHLHAEGKEIKILEKDGYKQISIPHPPSVLKNAHDYYNRNVAYILRELITPERNCKLVFQLNFGDSANFVKNLKRMFKCKIIQVVHYTNWSFSLLGDFKKLKSLYSTGLTMQTKNNMEIKRYKGIMKSVKDDIHLFSQVDKVVFVARHTFDTYSPYMDASIRERDKFVFIDNALKDSYKRITTVEKSKLKDKYHIPDNERIILFAGRLDEVKGVNFLISSFKSVVSIHANTRLVIAGDGNFQNLMTKAEYIWSKISFTGKINKETLYDFYRIADIGVICSLHEEFGLVAIEMMMYALPVIVTKTGGLEEIVEEGISGLKVPIITKKGKRQVDVKTLTAKMDYLLSNSQIADVLGNNGRKRFLEKYELSLFKEKMMKLYNNF